MACTGTSVHETSTLCHNSLTVVIGKWWHASRSATIDQTYSIGERSGECAGQGNSSSLARKVTTVQKTCSCELSCVTEVSKIGQSHRALTHQKCNDCCSYCWQCEQEVFETCIKWTSPIPSVQVKGQYKMVYASWQCVFTLMLPNTDVAIMMLYTESGFIRKDDVMPFLCPGLLLISPLEALLSVMQHQG